MRKVFLIALGTMAGLAGLAPAAHAGERILLRNGFDLRCNHHAQVEGHVRLYTSRSEDNYIELLPEEIAGVEAVPDPPSAAATRASAAPSASALPAKLSAEDLRQMLTQAGNEHNVDMNLLASVVKAESAGNARAVSHAGARGLMQLMPATATELGVADSFKPEENVRGGASYLDALLTRYHDNLSLALAAYNAGPAAVDKYHGIPPYRETRAYVARVIHEFNRRVGIHEAQARQAIAAAVPPSHGSR